MMQFCLGKLLRAKTAANGCDAHRFLGSRIVDPEAIHKEGDRNSGSEAHKIECSFPSARTQHQGPNLFPHDLPASPRYEVEHAKS